MDLKTKLAFALVAASLLSMAAFGGFTYLWAEDMLLEDSKHRLALLADSRQAEIEAAFERWRDEVRGLVARADAVAAPADPPADSDATLIGAEPLDAMARELSGAASASPRLRRVSLFDLDGRPLAGFDTGREIARPPEDDVVFAGARSAPDGHIDLVFHAWLRAGTRRVGLLEAVFDARALDRFIGPAPSFGASGATTLLLPLQAESPETQGATQRYLQIGARSGENANLASRSIADAPDAVSAALRGETQVFPSVADENEREVMAVTRPLAASGFGLIVSQDASQTEERAGRLLGNMRDLALSLAAFAILGGTLLGMHLGKPIHQLVEQVDRIRHGEVGLRLDAAGEDEVAFLAQSLNEFMDQLDRSSDLFRLGALRVLVIDPAGRTRDLLRDLLRNWSMEPTPVDSLEAGITAIKQATRANDPPQLVLLDESVVDGEVSELAARLRAETPGELPIIVLSSNAEALEADPLETADIGVLPKPVVASHLMESILGRMGVSAEGLEGTPDVLLKKTRPRRILLAEDSRLIQQITTSFLETWGHTVVVADNGRIACEQLGAGDFDLVLMDVEMPELNGIDATLAIRAQERDRRTPIIALTAEAMSTDRERCLAAGMDDYLTKPVDPKALYALIERTPARALASQPEAEVASEPGAPDDAAARIATAAARGGLVDWQCARDNTAGDPALLEELIAAFPEECRRQLEGIRLGIEQEDAPLLARSAHSLKGTALIFGAPTLVDAALSMEQLGKHAEFEGTGALLAQLEAEVRALGAELAGGPEGASKRGA